MAAEQRNDEHKIVANGVEYVPASLYGWARLLAQGAAAEVEQLREKLREAVAALERAGQREKDSVAFAGGVSKDHARLSRENTRLRDLYENAVQNRTRFGWTINHLLECEEALRTVEARVAELEAALDHVLVLMDRLRTDDEMGPCLDAIFRHVTAALSRPEGS